MMPLSSAAGSLRLPARERVAAPCRICGADVMAYPGLVAVCDSPECAMTQARQERQAERDRNLAKLVEELPRVLRRRGMDDLELESTREEVTPQLWDLCEDMIQDLMAQPENPEGGFGLVANAGQGADPGTGAGKSGLMAVLVMDWARASAEASIRAYGVSAPSKWAPLWANWPAKLDEIQGAFGDGWRSADLLDELKEAPLLVLDDLGAELARPDGWGDTQLYNVLEARTSARRATLWTTNLNKQELTSRYAKRIVSRLIGLAPALVVPLGLPDRRFQAAKARLRIHTLRRPQQA